MVTLIWAMTSDWVIGFKNKVPWYIKEDMLHFKNYTINKTILMGRKTFESLKCKALPNRKNIVITKNKDYKVEDPNIELISELEPFLKKYKESDEELVVIGGSRVYQDSLEYADMLIISIVRNMYVGDVYFPKFDIEKDFELIERKSHSDFNILYYKRRGNK